eukprot:TRINITY_DN3252_c0_g1_i14.p1 TRINITY_DN3252_c0_g1~~TRINITY_DN3252_c0_g1_i14.p1  ORF type:complete len:183 (-),score=40.62 TRINITY_DN3252_c0_g1_i14:284-832(-)
MVYLNQNTLASIPQDLFQGLRKLKFINLGENLLTDIPDKIFSGLSELKVVYLHRNLLTFISENIFRESPLLEVVDLNSNKLLELPSRLFHFTEVLRRIDISNNEGLVKSVPLEYWRGLFNLTRVDIACGHKFLGYSSNAVLEASKKSSMFVALDLIRYAQSKEPHALMDYAAFVSTTMEFLR